MEINWLEQAVAEADQHVVTGERLVARLRYRVDLLISHGHDVTQAAELLGTLEMVQREHIRHLNRLLGELGHASRKDQKETDSAVLVPATEIPERPETL